MIGPIISLCHELMLDLASISYASLGIGAATVDAGAAF